MRYSVESYNRWVEIDAKQFELSPDDAQRLHAGLTPLDPRSSGGSRLTGNI